MEQFEPEKDKLQWLHLGETGHKSVMYRLEPKNCNVHQSWLPHPAEISHAQIVKCKDGAKLRFLGVILISVLKHSSICKAQLTHCKKKITQSSTQHYWNSVLITWTSQRQSGKTEHRFITWYVTHHAHVCGMSISILLQIFTVGGKTCHVRDVARLPFRREIDSSRTNLIE